MGTNYFPSESGGGAAYGGSYKNASGLALRITASWTYTANTDTFKVTFSLQGMSNGSYSKVAWYNATGSITIDGITHNINGGTSSFVSDGEGTWITASNTSFSVTKSPTNGSVSIPISVNLAYVTRGYSTNYGRLLKNSWTLSRTTTPSYVLTISQSGGASVTVKNGSTTLSNGATIKKDDVLTITYTNDAAYTYSLTVNGTARSSGYQHTVSSNTTVAISRTIKSRNFSTSVTSPGQIEVWRTASPKANAALNTPLTPGTDKLYAQDVIHISFNVTNSAYEVVTHTVNGTATASTETDMTISNDSPALVIAMTQQIKRWALAIVTNNYTNKLNYTVNRINSPLGEGSTGPVSNGDLIYYNDVLELEWSCDPGYFANCKVNTTKIQETQLPYQWTTTVSPTLTLYGEAIQYTLARTATDCTITVERTFSDISDVPIGLISDSEKIYYGDKLNITVIPDSSQQLSIFTINNVDVKDFNPYNDYTVTTDTSIVAICALSGAGYIKIGNSWIKGQVYILINGTWQQCQGYILQNGQWVQCQ